MAKEIERKFIVASLPDFIERLACTTIKQGYVAIDEKGTETRIRKRSNDYVLTVKSRGALERIEVELPLTQADFEQLWPLTEGFRIEKDRYVYPIDGQIIEIDVFQGHLKGLVLAEIEFPDLDLSNNFQPFSWMIREVTYLSVFKNKNLSQLKDLQAIRKYL